MASKYGRDTATAGLKRDPVTDAILVNLSESATRNAELTDDDMMTRGVARDDDGAILVKVTGLPDSVVSRDLSAWDVNAADYVTDMANATAGLQAAWDAASAVGTPERPAVLLIPPGDYVTDVVVPKSNVDAWGYGAHIWKRSVSSSSQTNNTLWRMLEVLTNGSYYGTYDNITMRGLVFHGDGKSAGNTPDFKGSMLRFLYVRNLLLEDVEVADYCPNSWAFNLGGTGTVRRARIRGGQNLYEDGLHIMFGDWTVEEYDIESGDDAISLGCEPGDPYVAVDPQPLTARIGRGRAVSQLVAGLKVYQRTGATSAMAIEDVQVDGIDAWSKNGPAVWFNDERGAGAGNSLIKRAKVRGRARTGDAPMVPSSSRSGLSQVVTLTCADDCEIDVTAEFLADASAPAGWRLAKATDCRAPSLNIRTAALPKAGGVEFVRCTRAKLLGRVVATADTNAALLMLTDSDMLEVTAELLNQKSGLPIVIVSTGAATSTLRAHGGRWSHAAGATAGLVFQAATAADVAFVEMKNVDLRGAYLDTANAPVARPLGTNFTSIAAYDIQNNPGLISRARNNVSLASGATSVQVSNMGTHIDMLSARQVEQTMFTSDPGAVAKQWYDNQGANGFRWNAAPAPGVAVTGFYVVDVGRKPTN